MEEEPPRSRQQLILDQLTLLEEDLNKSVVQEKDRIRQLKTEAMKVDRELAERKRKLQDFKTKFHHKATATSQWDLPEDIARQLAVPSLRQLPCAPLATFHLNASQDAPNRIRGRLTFETRYRTALTDLEGFGKAWIIALRPSSEAIAPVQTQEDDPVPLQSTMPCRHSAECLIPIQVAPPSGQSGSSPLSRTFLSLVTVGHVDVRTGTVEVSFPLESAPVTVPGELPRMALAEQDLILDLKVYLPYVEAWSTPDQLAGSGQAEKRASVAAQYI
ncbi:hypothetical protein PAPYR_5661 [Paratrimastix pyriformis]|uniref:Uncharacterized protein n=1 Tax=Paratrimastix pyriformis TaxID=342808 RepID=A0ABQ8UJ79_9EUKA|nr:hypothetical protein PAPYR_5661 [Paratrimastix pyriformis]